MKGPFCKTSIGDLMSIEKKPSVETNEKKIEAKGDEALYLLTFEGKNEIAFEGKPEADGPNRIQLADSNGTKFTPEFAGTPTDKGTISNADWKYNGPMKGAGGKWVFSGKVTLPSSKIVLIYLVPQAATALTLHDGDQTFPLPR
jgi:hypothetical protein